MNTQQRTSQKNYAYEKMALDTIFDKLSESERENEKDKADIIAQKEKLNELDTIEVFKELT